MLLCQYLLALTFSFLLFVIHNYCYPSCFRKFVCCLRNMKFDYSDLFTELHVFKGCSFWYNILVIAVILMLTVVVYAVLIQ